MNRLERLADTREIFGLLCWLVLWIPLSMMPRMATAREQAKEADQNRLIEAIPPGHFLHAHADLHVRPCLTDGAVLMHVLSRCPLGQVVVKRDGRLTGEVVLEWVGL